MTSGTLGHGLAQGVYVTCPNHQYLDEDSGRAEGPNIGRHGEHLTITFLSMNRSAASIRLCRSIAEQIPGFKGEVLVVDNGSSVAELVKLEAHLAEAPFKWRIVRLGENCGVATARNLTMPHVATPWVMMLDGDIYLLHNPLPQLQRELATLGCHFMSMLLLDEDARTTRIRGGNIYLSHRQGSLVLGSGSAYLPEPIGDHTTPPPPFLGTFMPGGAAVFRCDTFNALGGYDEGLFVGFEDTEFSLRLFRAGLKVGASSVAAFVHAHLAISPGDDGLERSAEHFEAKHGYKVLRPGGDAGAGKREPVAGPSTGEDILPRSGKRTAKDRPKEKKRIVLVADIFGWALSNVADQIHKHLSDEFDIEVLSVKDIPHPSLLMKMTSGADLVHFLWREYLNHLDQDRDSYYIKLMFGGWDEFSRRHVDGRVFTTTVFDHLFLDPEETRARRRFYTDVLSGYTVASQKLMDIYSGIEGYAKPYCVTQDGVDLGRFGRTLQARSRDTGPHPFRIGWAGNSAFGHHSEKGLREDLKGFHTVLKPTIEKLRASGHDIVEYFADRQVRYIPHHRMHDYYQEIDVLVCCSLTEGTPNPVLEAMACGVPVISTNVGIVPEAFGPLQREFMMEQRSVKGLEALFERMIRNPSERAALSEENLERIQSWSWASRAESYRGFFRAMLERAGTAAGAVPAR